LDWAAGSSSQVPDEAVDETIPAGIVETTALHFLPPKNSLAGSWITSADSSKPLFVCNIGGEQNVLDIHVHFRICDTIEPLALTVSTAVVGKIYYLALDGAASNNLVPTSLPTTF
jgi:hypothetical protein